MEIRVTDDLDLATQLMTHPAIWPDLTNDDAPSLDEFRAPGCFLYLVALDPEPIGLFGLRALDTETVSMHVAILPSHRGAGTNRAVHMALSWIWANSAAERVVVRFEEWNVKARAAAKRAGFRECGREIGAVRKRGRLVDLIEMEMRRCHS